MWHDGLFGKWHLHAFVFAFYDMSKSKARHNKEFHHREISNKSRSLVQPDQVVQSMIWFLNDPETTDQYRTDHDQQRP